MVRGHNRAPLIDSGITLYPIIHRPLILYRWIHSVYRILWDSHGISHEKKLLPRSTASKQEYLPNTVPYGGTIWQHKEFIQLCSIEPQRDPIAAIQATWTQLCNVHEAFLMLGPVGQRPNCWPKRHTFFVWRNKEFSICNTPGCCFLFGL